MSSAQAHDLPQLDRLLKTEGFRQLAQDFGQTLVKSQTRQALEHLRRQALQGRLQQQDLDETTLLQAVAQAVQDKLQMGLQPVLNLSGTVIHTNLGRSMLPALALQRIQSGLNAPVDLEYDLQSGQRGERDEMIESLLCELTGAQAATVVNNNAAAVLLVLAALAADREVVVSRGELVEIGGSFRIPEVMQSAGAHLVEVGSTNRTHLRDYERAIHEKTALLMKVHASNYRIEGFTASVQETQLAELARKHQLPLVSDLGSGALADLSIWGLPREAMPQDMLAAGCDIVTFSGDKLLGGPQAGLIVGRKDLIARIRRHPMKRALRLGKLVLTALHASLQLYLQPEFLPQNIPIFRLLTRSQKDIRQMTEQLLPAARAALSSSFQVQFVELQSQIGSGSLPIERLPSAGLSISPLPGKKIKVQNLAHIMRQLPLPVIGRIQHDQLLLDLRSLEDVRLLTQQLDALKAHLSQKVDPA